MKEKRLRPIPGPGYRTQRSIGVPLPYDSRMEMRSGEWEWRTLYFRGRHPMLDEAEENQAYYDASTGLTLLGDLVFLYTPLRVILMVVLRFEPTDDEFGELDRWLAGQLDNLDREVSVEYFRGEYMQGWNGPPLGEGE